VGTVKKCNEKNFIGIQLLIFKKYLVPSFAVKTIVLRAIFGSILSLPSFSFGV
jgi:hypothetical protein